MIERDEAVYEAQRYLRCLYHHGEPIPPVIPDGYFGGATKAAVEAFQSEDELPVTGIIDRKTWDRLYESYCAITADCRCSGGIFPFETMLCGGCISPGDHSDLVLILQAMLETISTAYTQMEPVHITGVYDEATAENIRNFQQINNLPVTGEVDKTTWNRLAAAYNKYVNRE